MWPLIRFAIELALPTRIVLAERAGLSLAKVAARKRILRHSKLLRISRIRRKRMGMLDAITAGIKKDALSEVSEESTSSLVPHREAQYFPPNAPNAERIEVPQRPEVPNAYPSTPVPEIYRTGPQFSANINNSRTTNINNRLNSQPSPEQPQRGWLDNLTRLSNVPQLFSNVSSLADRWLPGLEWSSVVDVIGFPTTPTRTVVHYALAVAFGLVKQQRLSSTALTVDINYETNRVTVSYMSKAYWLTEFLTLCLYDINGAILPPDVAKDTQNLLNQKLDALSRSLVSGFRKGPTAGGIELGKQGTEFVGDALTTIIKAYKNMSRLLGPAAIYDMGEETIFGGRPSILLASLEQPQPFSEMQYKPLLTRTPAPNPQPPVPVGEDPTTGYSIDLRSLVAQALYDPGILPPIPDTNVSLDTVNTL